MISLATKKIDSNLAENFESNNFKMEVTEKTFAVLFNTLYQDKIASPMRELCTNAYDSHIDAGNYKPFKVQLPTPLDPTFKVRDFGTSLSHEDVMDLYSTAFGSTKGNTNAQVGYLGLGSKAPFAYTDSFLATAWLNGEQRNYICSLSNQQIPQISFIGSQPSVEPQGFQVSYTVKHKDVPGFNAAASKILMGFVGYDIYPEFNKEVSIKDHKEVCRVDDSLVIYNGNIVGGNKLYIRQGCVIYPVDFIDVNWINSYSLSLVITVPIGTVEVAASRETLSLDENTKETISKLVPDAKTKVANFINKKIETQPNFPTACAEYWANYRYIVPVGNLTYKGKVLAQYFKTPKFTNDMELLPKVGNKYPVSNIYSDKLLTYRFVIAEKDEKIVRVKARFETFSKKYHTDNSGFGKWNSYNSRVMYVKGANTDDLKLMVEAFGLNKDQLIYARDIADPGPPPKSPTANGNLNASKAYKPYRWTSGNTWTQSDLPSNGEYYWLPCEKKNGSIMFETGKPRQVWDTVQQKYVDASATPIKYAGKRFDDTLWDYITSARGLFKNFIPNYRLYLLTERSIKNHKPDDSKRLDTVVKNWIKNNERDIHLYQLKSLAEAEIESDAIQYVSDFSPLKRNIVWRDRYLFHEFDTTAEAEIRVTKAQKELNTFLAKYPMLKANRVAGAAKDYINLVNRTSNTTQKQKVKN